ncbi:MAG: leucine-rich repeat protein [Kiritimatiellae bacterium]|nr:leucine-rich repeat protein [Kiritimatiellia bacterium]
MKKALSLFLVMALCVGLLAMSAWADTSGDWEYSVVNGKATITGYSGSSSIVTIPSSLGTYPVTEIGNGAFQQCASLETVTIPNSITKIGHYAFSDCANLVSITIPESVTEIGESIFSGCIALTTLIVNESNQNYKSVDNVLFNRDGTILIHCAGCKTGSYNIPDGVTGFYSDSFSGCTGLTKISIPASVKDIWGGIGKHLFTGCTALQEIEVKAGNTDYYSEDGVLFTAVTIQGTPYVTLACFPQGMQGEYSIPDNVDQIDTAAFKNCVKLTKIIIQGVIASVGYNAFEGCTGLESVITTSELNEGGAGILDCAFKDCAFLAQIQIPGYVYSIGSGTFYGCDNLTSVIMPKNVGDISSNAFLACDSLTDVYYSGTETDWNNISISDGNDCLLNATIHYNSTGPAPTVTKYTVTFDADGGTPVPAQQSVEAGSKATKPNDPVKDGYDFTGWYNGNAAFDFDTPITASITLTAKWTEKSTGDETPTEPDTPTATKYTVSFDTDGGTPIPQPQSVEAGSKAVRPAIDPVKSGYTFDDWYKAGKTEKWDFSAYTVEADITLYAVWTQNAAPTPQPTYDDGDDYATTPSAPTTDTPASETVTNDDGSTTKITVDTDGGKTEETTVADGSVGTVKTDAEGALVSAEVTVSKEAVSNAKESGEAVTLPVEVKAAETAEEAVPIALTLPETETPMQVVIPVEDVKPGTVAMLVYEDGTTELVKTSTVNSDGVVMSLSGSATVLIVDNTKEFDDVDANAWYANDVGWAASREIMNGTGQGFEPELETSRGMLAQMIFNLDGAEAGEITEAFGDVSADDWYAASVSWATACGIAQGQGDSFGADATATREQTVVMLYNYAKYKGYDVSADGELAKFSDAEEISGWAQEAMRWAVGIGLINGMDDGTVAPGGSATRAQIAALMQRFCKFVIR